MQIMQVFFVFGLLSKLFLQQISNVTCEVEVMCEEYIEDSPRCQDRYYMYYRKIKS